MHVLSLVLQDITKPTCLILNGEVAQYYHTLRLVQAIFDSLLNFVVFQHLQIPK